MVLIKLNSDNYTGLVTPAAYEAIALQMSTGDYATHTKDVLIIPEAYAPEYTDYDASMSELYNVYPIEEERAQL